MDDKVIRISDDLHRAIKAEATWRGVSLKEWVEKQLRDGLPGSAKLPMNDEASPDAEE